MTDNELIEAAGLVDIFLGGLVRRYDMDIHQLNGIVNARLLLMNEHNDNIEEYMNFLNTVVAQPRPTPAPKILQ